MPVHDWTRVDDGIFHDFHATWMIELKRALNKGVLPPDYYALAEQIAGHVGPDVLTLQANRPDDREGSELRGAVAVADAPPRVRFSSVLEREHYTRKKRSLVIRHRSGDRIVALSEILSPGNKGSRHAVRSFVDKACSVLDRGYHLLLVDLFPPGPRDPQGIHALLAAEFGEEDSFTLPEDKQLTLAAYCADDPVRTFVEPVAVGDVLPDMPLFLTAEYYVAVPLEATYQLAWEAVPQRWREVLEDAR
jgi:hypothetical protein